MSISGGIRKLRRLLDVDTAGIQTGDTLSWDGTKFVDAAGGGGGSTTVGQMAQPQTSGITVTAGAFSANAMAWDSGIIAPANGYSTAAPAWAVLQGDTTQIQLDTGTYLFTIITSAAIIGANDGDGITTDVVRTGNGGTVFFKTDVYRQDIVMDGGGGTGALTKLVSIPASASRNKFKITVSGSSLTAFAGDGSIGVSVQIVKLS